MFSNVNIFNSNYTNLNGWAGAAIYSTGYVWLDIENSFFINNQVPMQLPTKYPPQPVYAFHILRKAYETIFNKYSEFY